MTEELKNFIDGTFVDGETNDFLDVLNPATTEVLARVPLSPPAQVDRAVDCASKAMEIWRRTPVTERIQYLFRFKQLLEEEFDAIAKITTEECGKTLAESKGELRRGIENVEVGCGMPSMIQGYNNEDIATGIDEIMIRQPVGIVAAITPFNFPAMIPLWFMPYALACGNCFILKPSERVPRTMAKMFSLLERAGLPRGVAQLVNGAKPTVDALLAHPKVRAISFVGSSPVARYIYLESAKSGKRAQCQGGAKNPVVILPDADPEMTIRIIADSAFGCAGQRCLAASIVVTVGDAKKKFEEAIIKVAEARVVGYGLDPKVEMGPVISPESKTRIEGCIDAAVAEGAKLLVDGRSVQISGFEQGSFLKPTVLTDVDPNGATAKTEIFGPVLSMVHVGSIEEAIALINNADYGNMACLFTTNGAAARQFRYEARAGNIGINLGVAAPMAFFPFTGWKESFFGDLHAQGRDAVDFYTEKKVVIERWPKDWARRF